jgi:hypothetical protein
MKPIEHERRGWYIEKGIPIALIVTFLMQTFAFIWWISYSQATTNSRLDSLEAQGKIMAVLPEKMATQAAQMNSVMMILTEMRTDIKDQTKIQNYKRSASRDQ